MFSKSSLYTKENIYIIKNCEKMNKESANTLLKFLEEPDGSVIGFFITNHIDNVLSTIQSRCQHIDVSFNDNIYESINLSKEEFDSYISLINNYLYDIEVNKKESILYNKKIFFELEKNEIIKIFQIILYIYQNELNNKYNIKTNIIELDFLQTLSTNNIIKKVNLIIEILEELSYNINVDLLLAKFVIEMDGINNETL